VTLSLKTGKSMILIANNDVSCNHIIIQSFHHHEDASLALWALLKVELLLGGLANHICSSAANTNIAVLTLFCPYQTGSLHHHQAPYESFPVGKSHLLW